MKRLIPALNDEDVAVETALTNKFEKIVAAYVDPVWNTISSKSKEVLNDLKIFRLLLTMLTKADCVTFLSTIYLYTSKDAVLRSSWVLTKSAEQVVTASRARVFSSSTSSQKQKTDNVNVTKKPPLDFQPEVHPKWLALSEILREISNSTSEFEETETFAAKLKTLIFTEDVRTCTILKDYLCHGSEATLGKIAKNCDNLKVDLTPDQLVKVDSIYSDNRGVKKYKRNGDKEEENVNDGEDEANKSRGPTTVQVTLTQIERKYEDIEFLQAPVFIRPLKSLGEEIFAVSETLEQLKPDVIIIFDPCKYFIIFLYFINFC